MTWFKYRDEIDLIVVWVVEIDSISVSRSELTWFSCGVKKRVFFLCLDAKQSVFVSGHRSRLDIGGGSKFQ